LRAWRCEACCPSKSNDNKSGVSCPHEAGDERESRDSGLPVAIPDIPAIDSADDDEPPSTPSAGENAIWGSSGESPKLVEARAKMMEMLGGTGADRPPSSSQEGWVASDVPEKPSALEWPEPPPIVADDKGGAPALPKKNPAPTPRR